MKGKKYIFLLLLFCISNALLAQNKMADKSAYYRYGNNFYTEIYASPNATLDSLTFYFFYKITYDELVFHLDFNGRYFAVANIDASFKDANGIIRKRILTNDTVQAKNFDETIQKTIFFTNLATFSAANNDYNVVIKLLNSKTSQINNVEKKISSYNLLAKNSTICEPYFVENTSNQHKFNTLISNSFVPFSVSKFFILLPISFEDNNNPVFEYKISERKNEEYKNIWGNFETISGTANILKNKRINAEFKNSEAKLQLQDVSFELNKSLAAGLLEIDANSNKFYPGYYDLTVKNARTNEEKTFPFEVRWEDIPLSLLNVEYAADLMYYVMNDAEFSHIKKGNYEEKYRKIIDYWEQKYPSKTPYNKALAEYFGRADYAFFNFQTITDKDGAKTDRGKIYILYGKPDMIENVVKNSVNSEIWYYERLQQKFVFDVVSVGIYKLVEIKELSENL